MTITRDPIYAMGTSEGERQRLVEQAVIYAATTRHLFAQAGIGPGMRVLDVGCGVGDVSLLAASIVGPTGAVVGVDTDVEALAVAQARADGAGLEHLQFVQGDLRDATFEAPFDAVVGRFVLMYLADPADAVRQVRRHVPPGGIVAFQEFQFEGLMRSFPDVPGSLY
ncbi:MAG TPA: class I SAM-dependent methyltransferase, partial [Acidimicrobiales bacterium]